MLRSEYQFLLQRVHGIRVNAVERLLVSAAEFTERYELSSATVEEVFDIGEAATTDALVELPITVLQFGSHESLVDIVFQVGWNVMFEAVEARLGRFGAPGYGS